MLSAEAVVIGGGPAGASAAMGLRRRGLEVALLESMPNTDPAHWKKVCGSFLNAEASECLNRMGLREAIFKAGAHPVTTLVMTEPSGRAARVSLASPHGGPLCLRRSTLDGFLLEEAAQRGVRVQMGTKADPHEIQAGVVILAGGKQSHLPRGDCSSRRGRRLSDDPDPERSRRGRGGVFAAPRREDKTGVGDSAWYGWNADFSVARSGAAEIELHFFSGGYIGLLGFSDGTMNLCGLAKQSFFRQSPGDLDGLIELACSENFMLKRRLQGTERLSNWRAVGPLPFGRMTPSLNDYFLVGDAAAVIDPFVGGGIGMALRSGLLLSSAFEGSRPLECYQKLWTKTFGRRLWAAKYFRWCLEKPWRVRSLISLMERWPLALEATSSFFSARPSVPQASVL